MNHILHREQVEALHSVDVQLGLITHGRYGSHFQHGIDPANGSVVLGVRDADYDVPARLLSNMEPGDVYTEESAMGTPVLSNRDLVDFIAQTARRTPYIPDPFEVHAVTTLPDLSVPMGQALENGRALQTITPFEYANGLALIKGVRRAITDSPPEVFESGNAGNLKIRDADMARGLGDNAVSMLNDGESSAGRKKILAFGAGSDHIGVKRILQSNGIPVTTQRARMSFLYAARREWALARSAGVVEPDRLTVFAIHEWFKNLRAHGYEPRNTTIKIP